MSLRGFKTWKDLLIQGRTGQSVTQLGQKADFPITLSGFSFLLCQRLSKTKTSKQKLGISGALNFKSFLAWPTLCSQNWEGGSVKNSAFWDIYRKDLCYYCLVSKSCLTLCDPMHCTPPDSSSVHGILQTRILEWVAISFSRGSSPEIKPVSPAWLADSLSPSHLRTP